MIVLLVLFWNTSGGWPKRALKKNKKCKPKLYSLVHNNIYILYNDFDGCLLEIYIYFRVFENPYSSYQFIQKCASYIHFLKKNFTFFPL